jgi:hypothetical protein
LAASRLFRFKSTTLEGLRWTPGATFETNKDRNKFNLLYDQEIQLHFGRVYKPVAVRARELHRKLKEKTPDLKLSEVRADYGYGLQVFAGTELGSSVTERTAKASRSTAEITIPTYAVARLRPRMRAFLETRWVTFDFSCTGRYLLAEENLTRESVDGRQIFLYQEKGWRPYGEASISINLDRSGHIALSSTYKLGSQPPNFLKANTVQTGILLRY